MALPHCPDRPLNEPEYYLSNEEQDEMNDALIDNYEMFHDK
jgi:hypothetical protein